MKVADIAARPSWLNKKIQLSSCSRLKVMLRDLNLETVCEQALCPNIGECFSHRQATFLILGKYCTRSCSFCNIQRHPPLPVDPDEPQRVAEVAWRLKLKHVVVTSVTRDDLEDGGAGHFVRVARAIKERIPAASIELLIPDFLLSLVSLHKVSEAPVDILGHNVETVPSLYPKVRQGSDYSRSLEVLRLLKEYAPQKKTKSGIMLGLGEREDEVLRVFTDLRKVECDFLSIGQYLAPTAKHYPVREYVRPEQFQSYRDIALSYGFLYVASAPYVRSSYLADAYLSRYQKATVMPVDVRHK